jgi:Flp pilus assembly protein TadG
MENHMHSSKLAIMKQTARFFARRACRDTKGVAAVEFAMIVPIMFVLFVGVVEFSQAITVDRRVTQVASSTADLIARTKSTTTSEVSGVMEIIAELVKPYATAPLKLTVLNVYSSPTDATDTRVCWSYNHNGGTTTYSNGQTYSLPTGVVQTGESVIVAEVTYAYTPIIFNFFFKTTTNFTETFYLKPRLSSSVEFDGTKCL